MKPKQLPVVKTTSLGLGLGVNQTNNLKTSPVDINKINLQNKNLNSSNNAQTPADISPGIPETLHWKDTPRRSTRRMSLPSGVKLMEGIIPPDLPDIIAGDVP